MTANSDMIDLSGRTVIITGASRGIGRAMALRFARAGANIVVAAKTATPHPKLPGTIMEVAKEIWQAGGKALPIQVDIRFEDQVSALIQATIDRFGGIDAIINNAGAVLLSNVENTSVKHYDLMQTVNSRGAFLLSHFSLPYLKDAANPHILSIAPPINIDAKWLKNHSPYTVSKYGMTLLTMGLSAEFESKGIAANCLWPKTLIATSAIEFAVGNKEALEFCRKPQIMADAAYEILVSKKGSISGECLIDEEFLRQRGIIDFDHYAYNPDNVGKLHPDIFIDGF